jgi:hypothetical protein
LNPTDSASYIDVVLSYNLAACYWNLKILEECADNLEKAVELLHTKVKSLEDLENTEVATTNDSL